MRYQEGQYLSERTPVHVCAAEVGVLAVHRPELRVLDALAKKPDYIEMFDVGTGGAEFIQVVVNIPRRRTAIHDAHVQRRARGQETAKNDFTLKTRDAQAGNNVWGVSMCLPKRSHLAISVQSRQHPCSLFISCASHAVAPSGSRTRSPAQHTSTLPLGHYIMHSLVIGCTRTVSSHWI